MWKAKNQQSIPEVKDEIIHAISNIEHPIHQNVIDDFNRKVDVYRAAKGGHLADIILRT